MREGGVVRGKGGVVVGNRVVCEGGVVQGMGW